VGERSMGWWKTERKRRVWAGMRFKWVFKLLIECVSNSCLPEVRL
jgi:hypothetical protein